MAASSGGTEAGALKEELGLSILTALDSLCKESSFCAKNLSEFLSRQIWSPIHRKSFMERLFHVLVEPTATEDVTHCFSPLMLDLLYRGTEMQEVSSSISSSLSSRDRFIVALSKVSKGRPDLQRFTRDFLSTGTNVVFGVFQRATTDASQSPLPPPPASKRKKKTKDGSHSAPPEASLLEILQSIFRFFHHDFDFYSRFWDWSPLYQLLNESNEVDAEVRWVAIDLMALLLSFSPEEREQLRERHVTEKDAVKFKMADIIKDLTTPPKALTRCYIDEASVEAPPQNYTKHAIGASDLTGKVVAVKGVLLPKLEISATSKTPGHPTRDEALCPVASTRRNLQSLALAVSSGRAVLVEGPSGSGKTTLVEHLARLTGRFGCPELTKIQLGEQTDSKMLIGAYACTDVPGKFVWQPGTLTQAVTRGHWVLLEDIDYAPSDVVAVLRPLIETGTLTVPGRGDVIRASPQFQLFATCREGIGGYRHATQSLEWSKMFWIVALEPLTRQELSEIIRFRQPHLSDIVEKLLEIYFSVASLSSGQSGVFGRRTLSNRDLLKWCSRLSDAAQENLAQTILQHAIDVFCGSVPASSLKRELASEIGAALNLTQSNVDYLLDSRRPEVNLSPEEGVFRVGRQRVAIKEADRVELTVSRAFFAYTKPSLTLLEQIAVASARYEPVLLVGETGVGKTSTIQFLAQQTGQTLKVINMNQQSDSSDLLGGYKPMDFRRIVLPIKNDFEDVFHRTFSRDQNVKFLSHVQDCFSKRRWSNLVKLMSHSCQSATAKISKSQNSFGCDKPEEFEALSKEWAAMRDRIMTLNEQIAHSASSISFTFVEGTLVQAIRNGWWLLLDEVNLASAETLECLSGVLEHRQGSVLLLEKGDVIPVDRHPDFRIFACMNPATDVGKKDLPAGIRNRFTELFVDELEAELDLMTLSAEYLKGVNLPQTVHKGLVKFYLDVRAKADWTLTDASGKKPHYSLRTFCRALRLASTNRYGHPIRSLYESFCLSFLTRLNRSSHPVVMEMVAASLKGASKNVSAILKQPLPEPRSEVSSTSVVPGPQQQHVLIKDYWLRRGSNAECVVDDFYVITDSVAANLKDLARVVSACSFPVLIQGETSVGKTSLIQYLADATGNKCVRINNHEHTDIQEYIGSYGADPVTGALVYQDGVLVEAMRKGYWVILDELNLAPTDVLEALNRLLDDNRELFIPETQETVKAHSMFMLFATQNPPGSYGGRKVLSRAFRNRFVEIHFDEIPSAELEVILHKKCSLPASYCKKLVGVMLELQRRRCSTGVFSGKQGFMTLRDLFRWAERYRRAEGEDSLNYDWEQHLADHGYLLLAGRVRKPADEVTILDVLHKFFKRKVDPDERLFTLSDQTSPISKLILKTVQRAGANEEFKHIVWTFNLRRLAVLVGVAMQFDEPALLVGETGCGKTSVCQVLSDINSQRLRILNCHMNTETADFLGGLRPSRDTTDKDDSASDESQTQRLFEWRDGPLIEAMKAGQHFLVDEISLADDSVLERLNSLLEPSRTILLAEKGANSKEMESVKAASTFRLVATMNPGGDYGKKELSPALRNRFTEIWCPQTESPEDLRQIVDHNVSPALAALGIGEKVACFAKWFSDHEMSRGFTLSIRDILTWVRFINAMMDPAATTTTTKLDGGECYVHGASMILLDSIASGKKGVYSNAAQVLKDECLGFLTNQFQLDANLFANLAVTEVTKVGSNFGICPFYIDRKVDLDEEMDDKDKSSDFSFASPTPFGNTFRILRAMQLRRPIMLEGSPGVGKTSLVSAIAAHAGRPLVRINLSEQTDISDLFGADLPVEGGVGGQFAWRDGPFLRALKMGHWIVLDELNLASQSVLEGLNACLDHRGEVFVPELGKTFHLNNNETRIFACQNPMSEGGGRKGLPKSFLNRFTQVYNSCLESADLCVILSHQYPEIPFETVTKMVNFNAALAGTQWRGSVKWEFNLRDLNRWCSLMRKHQTPPNFDPSQFVSLVYFDRFCDLEEKERAVFIYESIFETKDDFALHGRKDLYVTRSQLQVGHALINRNQLKVTSQLKITSHVIPTLESLIHCVNMNWMPILVGDANGKSSSVRLLASLLGQDLDVFSMSSSIDTTELLGGFEQFDGHRHLSEFKDRLDRLRAAARKDSLLRKSAPSMAWEKDVKSLQDCLDVTEMLLLSASDGDNEDALRQLSDDVKALMSRTNQAGIFEWIDSILVRAMKNGNWLLLDDVYLCNPSVLDRLNAFLEPNGVLSIHERGIGIGDRGHEYVVRAHPNFRIFLTMDNRFGELSRAMRNRGIEIAVRTIGETKDLNSVLEPILNHDQSREVLKMLRPNVPLSLSCYTQMAKEINSKRIHGLTAFDNVLASISPVLSKNVHLSKTSTQMLELITQKCQSELGNEAFRDDVSFSSAYELVHNPEACVVKSQANLVTGLVKDIITHGDVDVSEKVKHLTFGCILLSNLQSETDRSLRSHLILEIGQMCRQLRRYDMIENGTSLCNESSQNDIASGSDQMGNLDVNLQEIPRDIRWFPSFAYVVQWRLLRHSNEDLHMFRHNSMVEGNRSLILSLLATLEASLSEYLSKRTTSGPERQPLLLSYLVDLKHIPEEMCLPLFRPLFPLIRYMLQALKSHLKSSSSVVDSLVPPFVASLRMIKSFALQCLLPVKGGDNDVLELKLRWKILKEIMPAEIFNLASLTGQMELYEHTDLLASPSYHVARSRIGYPPPFSCSEEMSKYRDVTKLRENLKVFFPQTFTEDRLSFHPHFVAQHVLGNPAMIPLLKKINSDEISDTDIQNLKLALVENGFDLSPTFSLTDDQLQLFAPSSSSVTKGNMWPILDYHNLVQKVQLFSESSLPRDDHFSINSSDFVRGSDMAKRTEALFYLLSTLHARSSSPWVEWNILAYDQNISHKMTNPCYQHPALLPHPFLNATFTADVVSLLRGNFNYGKWNLTGIPLQNFQEKLKQTECLQEFLWTEGHSLLKLPTHSPVPFDCRDICQSVLSTLLDIMGPNDGQAMPESFDISSALQMLTGLISRHPEGQKLSPFMKVISNVTASEDFESLCKIIIVASFFIVHLVTPTSKIDPVEEQRVKLAVKVSELSEVEIEIRVSQDTFDQIDHCGKDQAKTNHPYVSALYARKVALLEEIQQLEKLVGFRPPMAIYTNLVDTAIHNLDTLSAPETVWSLLESRQSLRVKTWLDAQLLYLVKMRKEFYQFPDLITAVLENISRGMFFLHLLVAYRMKAEMRNRTSAIATCCRHLPNIAAIPNGDVTLKSRLKSHSLLNDAIVDQPPSEMSLNLQFLCMSSYLSLNNYHVLLTQNPQAEWYSSFEAFQSLWSSQQAEFDIKEAQENAFYRYKADQAGAEVDEERDVRANFPTYHEHFQDMTNAKPVAAATLTSDQASQPNMLDSSQMDYIVNSFKQIDNLECDTVCVFPPWTTTCEPRRAGNGVAGAKAGFMQYVYRCSTVLDSITSSFVEISDNSINSEAVGLHLAISQDFLNYRGSPPKVDALFDIYRDSFVNETTKCLPALESARERVKQLLDEFPNHPLLMVLLKIIHRIMRFSSDSPIIKFLTGVEFLVSKMKDWEQNAAKHVRLEEHIEKFHSLIVEWRKMELNQWQNCLDRVQQKSKTDGHKFWFHLNQSLDWYLATDDADAKKSLMATLQRFMESALLGDFIERLLMLYRFHKKFLSLWESSKSMKHHDLVTILGNAFAHYSRFVPTIDKAIQDQRAPIEKNLKGFIKVLRWTDMNYWGLREATFKTHRFLLSQMRAFEKVLSQPSQPLLSFNIDNAIQQIQPVSIVLPSFQIPLSFEGSLTHLKKMVELSSAIADADYVRECATSWDSNIGEVIETCSALRDLKANDDVEKEKRTKEIKHIQLKKQTALTSLFHHLKSQGLSFRKGVVRKQKDVDQSFMSKPQLTCLLPAQNGILLASLKDCERYYFDSLSLMTAFEHYLSEPSKELGPSTVERLKGYVFHLNVYVDETREVARESLTEWNGFQLHLASIKSLKKSMENDLANKTRTFVPPQEEMKTFVAEIHDLLVNSIDTLIQSNVVLEAKPDGCPGAKLTNVVSSHLEKLVGARATLRPKGFYGWQDFDSLTRHYDMLQQLVTDFHLILDTDLSNQLLASAMRAFLRRVSAKVQAFRAWSHAVLSLGKDYYSEYSKATTSGDQFGAIKLKVLKSIEQLFKAKQHFDENTEETLSGLIELIQKRRSLLTINDVTRFIGAILANVSSNSIEQANAAIQDLASLLPYLEVYAKVVEHILLTSAFVFRTTSKMLYVLLSIFSEIVLKGFCKPPELEEGEQEGESRSVDGIGLGDGDVSGAKDVSEEIASEDQLEEARKKDDAPEEKKDQGDAPKEEEHGVEMSEDFDAEANEPEDNDQDNQDNDEDEGEEEEMDKQMGDVEGSAGDALDDKLWGDENEEKEDLKEGESDGKQKSGESQMVAKDENSGKDTDDKDEEESPEKDGQKDINEMEDLPNDTRDFDESEMDDAQKEEQQAPEKFDMPENVDLGDLDDQNEPEAEENEEQEQSIKNDSAEEGPDNDQLNEMSDETPQQQESDSNEDKQDDTDEPSNDGEDGQPNEEKNMEENQTEQDNQDTVADATDKAEDSQDVAASAADSGHGDTDKDVDLKMADQPMDTTGVNDQQGSKDHDNAGLAESDSIEDGHRADQARQSSQPSEREKEKRSKKPGKSDERRNVAKEAGDNRIDEDVVVKEIDENANSDPKEKNESRNHDMYQHIKETDEAYDAQIKDAATEHQQQQVSEQEMNDPETREMLPEGEEEEQPAGRDVETLPPQEVKSSTEDAKHRQSKDEVAGEDAMVEDMNVDEEEEAEPDVPAVTSMMADSSIHTKTDFTFMSSEEMDKLRDDLRDEIGLLYTENATREPSSLWDQMNTLTDGLSQELCEELRLILEPTQATKLKGDYRTGKRLNMRKVIPYVASEFRKDKIWLRRTKPSKREYQIMIALDDSSSMSDNHSKQMAFESLSMISTALTKLEAGEIGVVSFGEIISLLHPFEKSFSHEAGASIMGQFTFAQKKTYVAKMLKQILTVMMKSRQTRQSTSETSQLLLIVSDGRGLFGEGVEKVNQTVRRCCQAGIFIVFIILDNPTLKDSIFDIRVPIFKPGSALPEFKPYLDCFPFPYYLILKDITHLPQILSKALSQWFEMVTASDR